MKQRDENRCKYCVECVKPCPYGFYNDDKCALSAEQCKKKKFVIEHLSPLIKSAGIDVREVTYEKRGGEEFVIIKYDNGHAVKKCVTADSLIALSRDALCGL